MDINNDKKEAKLWQERGRNKTLTLLDITHLAKTGIETCEGFCGSRKYVGEHQCRCIRERFDSPATYELYLTMRTRFLEMMKFGLLAKASSIWNREENNDK